MFWYFQKHFFTFSLLVEVGMNQEVKMNSNVRVGIYYLQMAVFIQVESI